MSKRKNLTLGIALVACVTGMAVAGAGFVLGDDAPAAGKDGANLVPLEIKLPRPLFQGTPKNIKQAPTMEKYNEKPRPPFLAPPGCKNLALNKKVTSSDMAPVVGELSLVTDGDKEGADGSFVELGPDKQWVQIDLGAPSEIHAFVVWHYHAEGRVYHAVVIQVADDPDFIENVKTVFNNDYSNSIGLGVGKNLEYIDDYRGKLIDARNDKKEPVKGRYVRLYSKGNTSNDMNHYVEVDVYGKEAK